LYREVLDVVLAVAAIYRREVNLRVRAAIVVGINIFYIDVARAHVEEPKVLFYALVVGGIGGISCSS
jgi:hypothetical protein